MAIVEKVEANIGDVVQFAHHVKDGIEHSLVVVGTEVRGFRGTFVTLLDKDLNKLENVPAKALKLVKGIHDGE